MKTKLTKDYIRVLVGALALSAALPSVTTAFSFFITPVTTELGFERSAFTLITTIIAAGNIITSPMIGNIVRRMGYRRMALVGAVWVGAGCFAYSFCSSIWSFYIVTAFMGILAYGSSFMMFMIVINEWFEERRTFFTAVGFMGMGVVGTLLGFILPGVIESFGWRTGYRAAAFLWVFFMLLAAVLLKGRPEELGMVPFGAKVAQGAQGEPVTYVAQGLTRAEAVRTRSMVFFLAMMFFNAIAYSFYQHIPSLAQQRGVGAVLAGTLMSVYSFASMGLKLLEGPFYDKFGLRRVGTLCFGVGAVSLVLFYFGKGFVPMAVCTVLYTVGVAANTLMGSQMVRGMYGMKEFGAIYGVASVFSTIGGAIGAPLWGAVYDVMGNYDVGLLASAVIMVTAIIMMRMAIRTAPNPID